MNEIIELYIDIFKINWNKQEKTFKSYVKTFFCNTIYCILYTSELIKK